MKNIIVYGTGEFYKENINNIRKDFNVLGVTNSYNDISNEDLLDEFIDLTKIAEMDFDYIYIATYKYDIFLEIMSNLSKIGIPLERTICSQSIEDIKYIEKDCRERTSLTDRTPYVQVCEAAVKYDSVFEHFRSNDFYKIALEHVRYDDSIKCVEIIECRNTLTEKMLENCLRNDSIGKPELHNYRIFEKEYVFAPTTIRYIKIADDILNDLYKDMSINNIAEIGVGYGGQCRVLQQVSEGCIKDYTLVDLPEAILLAEKYLRKTESAKNVNFLNGIEKIEPKNYDLVISNYAFSELDRRVQDKYYEEIIVNSKHGFMCWNSLSSIYNDGYTLEEFANKIEGAYIVEEKPLTAKQNYVLVW